MGIFVLCMFFAYTAKGKPLMARHYQVDCDGDVIANMVGTFDLRWYVIKIVLL